MLGLLLNRLGRNSHMHVFMYSSGTLVCMCREVCGHRQGEARFGPGYMGHPPVMIAKGECMHA